jgi:hypothetical protein
LVDALDEVVGHRLGEPLAPHQDVDMGGVLGQVHRRLAGRVAAADDGDLLGLAEAGLDGGGGVVDALPSNLS